jgi:disulfide bond formation protein DsbB
MNNNQDNLNSVRKPILWLGLTLIILGSVSLIYLAITTVEILQNPSQVELVKWLKSSVEESDLLVHGKFGNHNFEIEASEAVQYLFLGIIGLTMISILISVINAFISGGIKLVTFSQSTPKAAQDDK